MAILEQYSFAAHRNIYDREETSNYETRHIRTEISIPDCVNKDTGMLILVPGYGGNIDSHVYKKIRKNLADQYNLIIIQCDYFGNCCMAETFPAELNKVLDNIVKADIIYREDLHETVKEFNDMGFMQALDIVSSTLCSIEVINKKGYTFNSNRVYIFGPSHGAYLAYLANAMCPGLYSALIDVSAYLSPYYMFNSRITLTSFNSGSIQVRVVREYLIKNYEQMRYNEKLYSLPFLYKNRKNMCKIIAMQGTEDWMVDAEEKKNFISNIDYADILMITPEDVDGILCKNAEHGLGIDFFELFKIIIPVLDEGVREQKQYIDLPQKVKVGDDETHIIISYESGLPEILELTW